MTLSSLPASHTTSNTSWTPPQLLQIFSASNSALDKSASLSIIKSKRHNTDRPVEHHQFYVQDQLIPFLKKDEHYRYLGVPIGLIHNIDDLDHIVDKLIPDMEKLEQSLLAPWQKLDAIRTFVQTCLIYALRAGSPKKKTLEDYRTKLIKTVRLICNLPNRATTHYVFAHKRAGGLGLQDPTKECDVQTIVQATKMLASQDPVVAGIARAELLQTVKFAASQANPTASLVSNYLSATPDDRLRHMNYRTQSLWTRTRKAARCLKISQDVARFLDKIIFLKSRIFFLSTNIVSRIIFLKSRIIFLKSSKIISSLLQDNYLDEIS